VVPVNYSHFPAKQVVDRGVFHLFYSTIKKSASLKAKFVSFFTTQGFPYPSGRKNPPRNKTYIYENNLASLVMNGKITHFGVPLKTEDP
jgi:hypothetical protein